MGLDWLGFIIDMALGKLLTLAVLKVVWYLSLPPLGQCCVMNGRSMFSQGGLFQVYLGDGISQGGCLFLLKGRAILEVGVRPKLRLGGAVNVVTVAVFLQPSGSAALQRSLVSEGDSERPGWRKHCCFTASCRVSTSPLSPLGIWESDKI